MVWSDGKVSSIKVSFIAPGQGTTPAFKNFQIIVSVLPRGTQLIDEINHFNEYNHVLINENLQQTYDRINNIIHNPNQAMMATLQYFHTRHRMNFQQCVVYNTFLV